MRDDLEPSDPNRVPAPEAGRSGVPSPEPASGARGRPTLRVVVVDDHSIFRSGLRADLDRSIEVVGEAADVPQAVAVVLAQRPDVVLLDVHLPGERMPPAQVARRCSGVRLPTCPTRGSSPSACPTRRRTWSA
ncbi:hypothetical protein GCM10025870_13510 [Agromyces marinus]|uniref:Response regulatory domain-containing protein n=1 Tax=Agromyces marinus TaxID=1389020 RepID=A0ABM8H0I4_9MICO|nr:hypothetical protein GCM10025870_13510 [Agromyces marinus]